MSARTATLAGLAGLALLALLAMSVGLWPVASPPPAQRADLRPQLARRHAGQASAAAATGAPGAPERVEAHVLCEAPQAGEIGILDGPGEQGARLLSPCAGGLDLWALGDAPPRRLLRVDIAGEGLSAGPALGADLDGDGSWDFVFSLRATTPDAAHRRGLYWARGREAGGFEAPERLLPVSVDELLWTPRHGAQGETGALWVAVHEPAPRARALLWRVTPGPSPERAGQWELPGPALGLVPAPGDAAALWGLGGGVLWQKELADDAAPEAQLEVAEAQGLSIVSGRVHVRAAGGLRAVRELADGSLALAPPELPSLPAPRATIEAAASTADGTPLVVADGKLWVWRDGGAMALAGVGGARVETLLDWRGTAWLWLSGLSGAQATGLARLPARGVPEGPLELVARPAGAAADVARVGVP